MTMVDLVSIPSFSADMRLHCGSTAIARRRRRLPFPPEGGGDLRRRSTAPRRDRYARRRRATDAAAPTPPPRRTLPMSLCHARLPSASPRRALFARQEHWRTRAYVEDPDAAIGDPRCRTACSGAGQAPLGEDNLARENQAAPRGRATNILSSKLNELVRSRRLELPRLATQRPQRCASTNSATTARHGRAAPEGRSEVGFSKGLSQPQALKS